MKIRSCIQSMKYFTNHDLASTLLYLLVLCIKRQKKTKKKKLAHKHGNQVKAKTDVLCLITKQNLCSLK